MKHLYLALLLLSPVITYAQTLTLQSMIVSFVSFLTVYVIPFLLAIAFLLFVINAIRFFLLGATEDEGRKKAKSLAIYSIFAFVFIVIFWGVVNLLANSLSLSDNDKPTPDYFEAFDNDFGDSPNPTPSPEPDSDPFPDNPEPTPPTRGDCLINQGGDLITVQLTEAECRDRGGIPD